MSCYTGTIESGTFNFFLLGVPRVLLDFTPIVMVTFETPEFCKFAGLNLTGSVVVGLSWQLDYIRLSRILRTTALFATNYTLGKNLLHLVNRY